MDAAAMDAAAVDAAAAEARAKRADAVAVQMDVGFAALPESSVAVGEESGLAGSAMAIFMSDMTG